MDLSGLEWLVFNFFALVISGGIFLLSLIVAILVWKIKGTAVKNQRAYAFIAGSFFPMIISGIGFLLIVIEDSFLHIISHRMWRLLDDFALYHVTLLGVLMIVVTVLLYRKKQVKQ